MPPRTIYLLKRLENASRTRLDDHLKPMGLTAGQYTTLSLLGGHDGLSAAALARRAMISPQSMCEAVSALEKKGLIARAANDQNRRILDIKLSAKGRRLLERAESRVDLIEAELFARLAPASLERFRKTLAVILKAQVSGREP